MPQIQMLEPGRPGIGSSVGQALGGGLSQGLSAGLNQMLEQKRNRSQLEGLAPIFQQFGLTPEQITQIVGSGLPAQHAVQVAGLLKPQKISDKQIAASEDKEAATNAAKRLHELLPQAGYTKSHMTYYAGGALNRQQAQDREEFDKQGFLLADKAFTKFNKGTITKEKLQYIKDEMAPNSKYTDRTNLGRMKALETVLNLPDGSGLKQYEKALKSGKIPSKQFDERPPLESFQQ